MLQGIDVSTLKGNIGYFLTSWITKYYKTVDDTGAIKATEVTNN